MKRAEGQPTEELALEGLLYAEAIEKLSNGQLYYKGKTKLIGQETTAKRINDWVSQQFVARQTESHILDLCTSIENEALYGMLYKEAVQQLRQGKFNVLGADNTATTIKNWVNQQYLKRTI